MLRSRVFILLITLLAASGAAPAQDAPVDAAPLPELPLATESGPGVAMVQGLAVNDALNVRAEASPVGKVMGRLPNGATVNKHECKGVNGYDWCRVDAIEVKDVAGWAPARYLRMLDLGDDEAGVAAVAPEAGDPAPTVAAEVQGAAAETTPVAVSPSPRPDGPDVAPAPVLPPAAAAVAPVAEPAPEAAAAGTEKDDRPTQAQPSTPPGGPAGQRAEAVPLPPGLDARFAGAPVPEVPTPPLSATEPFYMLALSDVATEEAKAETAPAELSPTAPAGQAQPEPPARPEGDKVAALAPSTEPAIAFDIPCARYVGQPMTRCRAEAKRAAGGAADVVVTWPDGGTRVLQFRDGLPASSNGRGEFRYVREGNLNMIRVGVSERFEITDDQSTGG